MDISGKVFIVTGGASGLGEGTALGDLVLHDIEADCSHLPAELDHERKPYVSETDDRNRRHNVFLFLGGAVARGRTGSAGAAVGVLEAHDVVFSEVAPGLHFDQFQRDLAGIGQAMDLAERDVGTLVLGQQHLAVSASDFGRAADAKIGVVGMGVDNHRACGDGWVRVHLAHTD